MEDVEETQDNKIVFDQLREAYTLLETKHMNQLNQWINTLVKMDLAVNSEMIMLLHWLLLITHHTRVGQGRKGKVDQTSHQSERRSI